MIWSIYIYIYHIYTHMYIIYTYVYHMYICRCIYNIPTKCTWKAANLLTMTSNCEAFWKIQHLFERKLHGAQLRIAAPRVVPRTNATGGAPRATSHNVAGVDWSAKVSRRPQLLRQPSESSHSNKVNRCKVPSNMSKQSFCWEVSDCKCLSCEWTKLG